MKYYTIQENSIITAENKNALKRYYKGAFPLPDDYEDGKYIVKDRMLVLNENFEAQKAQKERERINMLSLTAADVERAIYKAKGMDFEDVIKLVTYLSKGELDIETGKIINRGIDIDVKALKIELKANNFYRGNPYIEQVGALLGFTPQMLDEFFETGDYTKLIVEEEVDNTEETTKGVQK